MFHSCPSRVKINDFDFLGKFAVPSSPSELYSRMLLPVSEWESGIRMKIVLFEVDYKLDVVGLWVFSREWEFFLEILEFHDGNLFQLQVEEICIWQADHKMPHFLSCLAEIWTRLQSAFITRECHQGAPPWLDQMKVAEDQFRILELFYSCFPDGQFSICIHKNRFEVNCRSICWLVFSGQPPAKLVFFLASRFR